MMVEQPDGWHLEDIKAAVRKKGITLKALAIAHGLEPTATKQALRRPHTKGERAIAAVLGVAPQLIWPDRYEEDGRPKRGRTVQRKARRRTAQQKSTPAVPPAERGEDA
jgi:Ner family transcriptional regulator